LIVICASSLFLRISSSVFPAVPSITNFFFERFGVMGAAVAW